MPHDHHDHHPGCSHAAPATDRYRRVLLVALAINLTMFFVEIIGGLAAKSVSLQADAIDFLGDALNYGISAFVLGMALKWRALTALLKGLMMGGFGLWVIGMILYHALAGTLPGAFVMGTIGFAALVANLTCALLLMQYRDGDANMQAVWLCTRNDALGNVAVMAAAAGVFTTQTGWPDLAVALLMAGLALWSAYRVIPRALGELRETTA
jgi:Co/Zn/Cd efflux system component